MQDIVCFQLNCPTVKAKQRVLTSRCSCSRRCCVAKRMEEAFRVAAFPNFLVYAYTTGKLKYHDINPPSRKTKRSTLASARGCGRNEHQTSEITGKRCLCKYMYRQKEFTPLRISRASCFRDACLSKIEGPRDQRRNRSRFRPHAAVQSCYLGAERPELIPVDDDCSCSWRN